MRRQQIVIVGGGPVGLVMALALNHARLPNVDITVLERGRLVAPAAAVAFDHRVYALSPQSIALLTGLGVWQQVERRRRTPIDAMHIFGEPHADDASRPNIVFAHGAPLAEVIEHRALIAALVASLANTNILLKEGDALAAISMSKVSHAARLITLQSGESIHADLIIGADGRGSVVRTLAGIDVNEKDYLSDGVVANFDTELPHRNIARQWFSKDGVLAYLPLQGNRISIVWSTSRTHAQALGVLSDDGFAETVMKAGHNALGKLQLSSLREAIPLKRLRAHDWVKDGIALVGDAAHAIHPLAGQGMNLGFGDVEALCDVLQTRGKFSKLGDIALLRRYARNRAEAAVLMGQTTDYLQGLFERDDAVAKWIRRSGFTWFDQIPLVKTFATDYAVHA